MRFCFDPRAEAEFHETVRYYEDCQTGLGLQFAEEIYAAIRRVDEYPDAWSALSENTRRCLVNRFPFTGRRISKIADGADVQAGCR
jgi:hypothetical protein